MRSASPARTSKTTGRSNSAKTENTSQVDLDLDLFDPDDEYSD